MDAISYSNFTTPGQGVWGPVTATLDWCEANYQFSPRIAEMANTFSNLFCIGIALYGGLMARQESLPTRFSTGYIGVALVGIGSFAFHATLLFEAQLADELPMIYTASYSVFLLSDTGPGFGISSWRSRCIIFVLVSLNLLFTLTYVANRNPVYHQFVFGVVVALTSVRTAFLLGWSDSAREIPPEKRAVIKGFFWTGVATFALGFVVWNLDNIYCDTLTQWKRSIGWPLAFLLEGHSWWHILTAAGTYLKIVGILYLTLCVKDDHRKYGVGYIYGLPYVRRLGSGKAKVL
jgi:dihydroceramidase